MDKKNFYLDAIRDVVPANKEDQIQDAFYSFLELEHLYDSVIELVKTQLGIFDNEFSMRFQRNPIHNIESRIKTPQSIVGKLQRKGMPVTPESARNNLMDIAGVRVICYYIDDIYAIADLLTVQSGFHLRKIKDYIKNPKPNGYRSFHMILDVPVHMSTGVQIAPVEIQIRTIAMDFWASFEHKVKYKTKNTYSIIFIFGSISFKNIPCFFSNTSVMSYPFSCSLFTSITNAFSIPPMSNEYAPNSSFFIFCFLLLDYIQVLFLLFVFYCNCLSNFILFLLINQYFYYYFT